MKAEIITIGDEILIGQITDTNSQWIATELNKVGVSVHQISSIQDEREHILTALKEAQSRADLVLITGGLGPTKDDITKKTLCEYFDNKELVYREEVYENIKRLFKKINHPLNDAQKYQAMVPENATVLKNNFGTAPGMWFEENNTVFVSMPGVPYEMKGLISKEVLPKLISQFQLPYILHKTVQTYGQGESVIAERIADWEENLPEEFKLAYLPSFGKVRLRLSAKGSNKDILDAKMRDELASLTNIIDDIIIGYDDGETIEKSVGNLLKQNHLTLATAESMTGGRLASTIVSISGASSYFKGSVITYSEETKKSLLNVSDQSIQHYTVVSKEVTSEMALKALEKFKTDYTIAITGNAGPDIDNTDKTVGTVFIAIASKEKVNCHQFDFGQPREKVIKRTVNKALELLQNEIIKNT